MIWTEKPKLEHPVHVNTMYNGARPAFHMIDEAARFCTASFLHIQSRKKSWKTIPQMFCLIRSDWPAYIVVDQGSP